jgi:hypothetical protein
MMSLMIVRICVWVIGITAMTTVVAVQHKGNSLLYRRARCVYQLRDHGHLHLTSCMQTLHLTVMTSAAAAAAASAAAAAAAVCWYIINSQ